MKKNYILIFSVALVTSAFSQFSVKVIDHTLAKIDGNLYASKFELSNRLYTEFLNAIEKSNDAQLIESSQIDSINWRESKSYNEPYVHYYHTHPAYKDYPVVNISYQAAQNYCKWLTATYNADPKRKFKKVVFRLPSEQEWIKAAEGGTGGAQYPWPGKDLYTKEKFAKCNFTRDQKDSVYGVNPVADNADILAPVKCYQKNGYGLFNMSGNVAEMVSDHSITKGGAWRLTAEYLTLSSQYKYDGLPKQFVGFRYFAEVLEE